MATNKKTSKQSRSKSSKSAGASASKRSNTASDSRPGANGKTRGAGSKQKQWPRGKAQSRRSQQPPRRQQSNSGGGGNGGQGRIRRAASTAVGSAKEHPVAAGVIGATLAALAYAGVYALASGRQTGERRKSRGAGGAFDRANRDDDDEDADASSEVASTDEHNERSRAGGRRGQSLQQVQSMWEGHPLMLAAAPIVAGGMIGLLLPRTQVEDKTFGEFSDRLAGNAKRTGRQLLQQGRHKIVRALSEGASATVNEAERVGLTPDRVGRKLRRIASHVRDAITKAITG